MGAAALCRPVGVDVPVGGSPALLLRFRTRGPLVDRVLATPDLDLRQASATRLLAAAEVDLGADAPGVGPSAQDAARGVAETVTTVAERARGQLGRALRGGDDAVLERATVGVRPMPADGVPIVGPVREAAGLYLAVLHAGVTLAATVGRLAAAELLGDTPSPLLAPCRPERFAATRFGVRRVPLGDRTGA